MTNNLKKLLTLVKGVALFSQSAELMAKCEDYYDDQLVEYKQNFSEKERSYFKSLTQYELDALWSLSDEEIQAQFENSDNYKDFLTMITNLKAMGESRAVLDELQTLFRCSEKIND